MRPSTHKSQRSTPLATPHSRVTMPLVILYPCPGTICFNAGTRGLNSAVKSAVSGRASILVVACGKAHCRATRPVKTIIRVVEVTTISCFKTALTRPQVSPSLLCTLLPWHLLLLSALSLRREYTAQSQPTAATTALVGINLTARREIKSFPRPYTYGTPLPILPHMAVKAKRAPRP
jgi:hypothetical protein